jgi:hypothetical protein
VSNILEQLKEQNHHEYVFDDGVKVGYHTLDLADYIVEIGQIPTPALNLPVDGTPPTEEQAMAMIGENPDSFAKQLDMQRKIAAEMLDSVNGEDIEPDDDRLAIVGQLGAMKRNVLFMLATEQMSPDKGSDPGEA